MSMGGCYIALSQEELDQEIENDTLEKNIDNYDYATLEQAWDAFRILFGDEIYGQDFEGASLGEQAFIHYADEVEQVAARLNGISEDQFKNMLEDNEFKSSDFYWNHVWTKETEEMIKFFTDMKAFFNRSLNENKLVLFYIA